MELVERYSTHQRPIQFSFFISISIHLSALLIIYYFSQFAPTPKYLTGPIYTVTLTDIPVRNISRPAPVAPRETRPTVTIPTPAQPRQQPAEPIPTPAARDEREMVLPDIRRADRRPPIQLTERQTTPNLPRPVIQPQINPIRQEQLMSSGSMLGAVRGERQGTEATQSDIMQTIAHGRNIPGALEFPDPHYLQIIQNKITQNWAPPAGILGTRKELSLVVEFNIDRSGKINQIRIIEPSGSALLDQSSIRSVQLSDPFPPLPSLWEPDILKVYFRFTYTS